MNSPTARAPVLETLVRVFNIVAVLTAGGWGYYLFLKFEREQRGQQLQLSQLRLEKERVGLEDIRSSKLAIAYNAVAADLGPAPESPRRRFRASFQYEIVSQSQTRNEITYITLQAFVAEFPPLDSARAVDVSSLGPNAGLEWKHALSKGYYYPPAMESPLSFVDDAGGKIPFQKGGGGTAELDFGEKSDGSLDIVIQANPDDFVGFKCFIAINGGGGPEDRWTLTRIFNLAEFGPKP